MVTGVELATDAVGKLNVWELLPVLIVTLAAGNAAFDPVSVIAAPPLGTAAVRFTVTLTFTVSAVGDARGFEIVMPAALVPCGREAVLTVSLQRSRRYYRFPTTLATTGPAWIPMRAFQPAWCRDRITFPEPVLALASASPCARKPASVRSRDRSAR